jgi:hypothetical protein
VGLNLDVENRLWGVLRRKQVFRKVLGLRLKVSATELAAVLRYAALVIDYQWLELLHFNFLHWTKLSFRGHQL